MNEKHFERAISLASKRIGFTSPNPVVAAVIVKGDKIVAEGVHMASGEPHAEVLAMKALMDKSGVVYTDFEPELFRNAELYVTLEPCCHNGKTPPCTDVIIAAGFKKVYIGMIDPSSKVNGKGVRKLKKAGISVEVLKPENGLALKIRELNQPFIKISEFGLPHVTLKAGMSLDGKITSANGDSKWITGELARRNSKLERSFCDAVFVGAGTVRSDDCELAVSGRFRSKNILRCVFGRKLDLPLNRKVFRDSNLIYFVSDLGNKEKQLKYKKSGIKVKKVSDGVLGVKQALQYLAKNDVQSVFVEGGSSIHGLFVDASIRYGHIIDRLVLYVAPKIIGGRDSLSFVGGEGALKLSKSLEVSDVAVSKIADDLKITGLVNSY